jgi:hypothetical protein
MNDVSEIVEEAKDAKKYDFPVSPISTADDLLTKGQFPFNVKIIKWQDSNIGKYIEFKIGVFYQEGPGSKKSTDFGRESIQEERPSSAFNWFVFKRYSNFVDLSESLAPYFKAEGLDAPMLPPKIELLNDSQHNQRLSHRKRQLQTYLREVIQLLSDRLPPNLLVFLGLHEQQALGFTNAQQV